MSQTKTGSLFYLLSLSNMLDLIPGSSVHYSSLLYFDNPSARWKANELGNMCAFTACRLRALSVRYAGLFRYSGSTFVYFLRKGSSGFPSDRWSGVCIAFAPRILCTILGGGYSLQFWIIGSFGDIMDNWAKGVL